MDPNANVESQISILRRQLAGQALPGDRARYLDLRLALHEWVDGGGFLPKSSLVQTLHDLKRRTGEKGYVLSRRTSRRRGW